MRLNPDAMARLKGGTFTAQAASFFFDTLQKQMELVGSTRSSISLDFHKPEDKVEPGDVFPVITLTLQATP